jgi:hypothetical protein
MKELVLSATDRAGNKATELRYQVSSLEPVSLVKLERPGLWSREAELRVAGKLSRAERVELRVAERLVDIDSQGEFSVAVPLRQGANELAISVRDLAFEKNLTIPAIKIQRDDVQPVIAIAKSVERVSPPQGETALSLRLEPPQARISGAVREDNLDELRIEW